MTERQICLRLDVRRALDRLSAKQRRAVLAMALLGLTGAEYARVAGITQGTAWENLRRATFNLRRFLRPYATAHR